MQNFTTTNSADFLTNLAVWLLKRTDRSIENGYERNATMMEESFQLHHHLFSSFNIFVIYTIKKTSVKLGRHGMVFIYLVHFC